MLAHSRYIPLILAVITLLATSCGGNGAAQQLDDVAAIIEDNPDSALALFRAIDPTSLSGKAQKARYSMLHAMALDKNYIDTADMRVIQPALDWYADHGSPDDRLKAMYYAGCIASNGGDMDAEMGYYVKAAQWMDQANDTLAICRLLTAQSLLYRGIYDLSADIACNQKAGPMAEAVGRYDYALYSYHRVLYAACGRNDSTTARHALNDIRRILSKWNEGDESMALHQLVFENTFGDTASIQRVLDSVGIPSTETQAMDIVLAYKELGQNSKVLDLLAQIPMPEDGSLRVRYLISKFQASAELGLWQQAYEALFHYANLCDTIESRKLIQRLQFSEEKYGLELAALEAQNAKEKQWYQSLAIILGLAIIVIILLALYRSNRRKRLQESQRREIEEQKRQIAEHEAKLAQTENAKLRLEAQNLKLQQEKFQMLADTLQTERDELQEILKRKESLNQAIIEPLRRRSAMLDRFLISEITDNIQLGKTFQKWVNDLTANRKELLSDMRVAFQAQHPKVYDDLMEKGLTETEMTYICLYALGLRGSEVGEVLGTTRQYVVSSEIRRKLGLDVHKENLGPYIQKILKSHQ